MADGSTFQAELHHRGRAVTLVWVPDDVADRLGPGAVRRPVRGTVGGQAVSGWVRRVRDASGWYLLLDSEVRSRLPAGATVTVELATDPEPAPEDLPDDVADLLAGFPRAQAGWDDLPPSRRREYLAWIEEVPPGETRRRRIMNAIEKLREDER